MRLGVGTRQKLRPDRKRSGYLSQEQQGIICTEESAGRMRLRRGTIQALAFGDGDVTLASHTQGAPGPLVGRSFQLSTQYQTMLLYIVGIL